MKFIRSRAAAALVLCLCTLLTLAVPRGEVRASGCSDGNHSYALYVNDYKMDWTDPTNPNKNYAIVSIHCDCYQYTTVNHLKVTGECCLNTPKWCGNPYTTSLRFEYYEYNTQTGEVSSTPKTYYAGNSWVEENGKRKVLEHDYEGAQVSYSLEANTDLYVDMLSSYEAMKEYFGAQGHTVNKPELMQYTSVSCTAKRECKRDNCDNVQTDTLKNVSVTLKSLTNPTCTTDGSVTFELSADLNGFSSEWARSNRTQSERKVYTLKALDHAFLHFKRDPNGTTMTATCARAGCSATLTLPLDERYAEDPDEETLSPFLQPDAYPDYDEESAEESAGTEETEEAKETETSEAVTAPKTGEGTGVYALAMLSALALSAALIRRRKEANKA